MKKCFKCERELPMSEYYSHPRMADGHLNKCKDCTKQDTADRIARKQKDPEWVIGEAARCREKGNRARREGRNKKQSPENRKASLLKWGLANPQKRKAHFAVSNAIRDGKIKRKPCEVCGSTDSEAHHDDYSKPLDVMWLCPKHHAERHVHLRDIERRKKATAAA